MSPRLRQQRSTFLLFLGAAYVSLMAALPLATAQLSLAHYAMGERVGGQPTFEQLDRNRDGYVDRREAAALPGLDSVFDAADRRARGRLDKVDYAKALAMLDERK
jgi:hypothetical protein